MNDSTMTKIATRWAKSIQQAGCTWYDFAAEIAAEYGKGKKTEEDFATVRRILTDALLAAGFQPAYAQKLPYRLLAAANIVSPSKRGKGKKQKNGKGNKGEPITTLTREAFLADAAAKFDALDSAGMLALAQTFVKFAKQAQK